MPTIHKYPLLWGETFQLALYTGAEILTLQMQNDRPCVWVREQVSDMRQVLNLRWVGTGQEAPATSRYLGTVQVGGYVWHLFQD
jgi:hypothetical protein